MEYSPIKTVINLSFLLSDLPACPVDLQLRTSNTSVVLTWTRGPNSGLNQTTLLYTRSNDSSADDLIGTVDDVTRDTLTYPLRHLDPNTTHVFSVHVKNLLGIIKCPSLDVYLLNSDLKLLLAKNETYANVTEYFIDVVDNATDVEISDKETTTETIITTTMLPEPSLLQYIIPPVAVAVVTVVVILVLWFKKGSFRCKQPTVKKQIVTSTHIARQPIPTPHEHNIGDGYLVVLDSRGDSNQNLQTHDQLGIEPWTSRFHHSARNRLSSSVLNTASFDVGTGTYYTTVDTQEKYIDIRGNNTTQCMLVESDINRIHLASNDTVLYDPSGSLFSQSGYTREKYIDIRTCNAGQPTNSEQHEIISDNIHDPITEVITTGLNPDVHDAHETSLSSNVYETIDYTNSL
ncbi:uncharacterized protein LOC131936208 [Physella acuta]|uniref:uncharacterized protein LOC131936208 n=1 Tax=Physella acuta TaxID=109671 RepID=UPI0027DB04A5|nr:uncharacterized protein LOC131936208 [Physella acuta]